MGVVGNKFKLLFFLGFLLFSAAIYADDDVNSNDNLEETEDDEDLEEEPPFPEENDVVVLGEDNFDNFIAANDVSLVEFYAPWCGHCKSLAPVYEKAAVTLKAAPVPVPLAKVDATEHKELASRFDVSGYPTLKIFKNGEAIDYDGPRDEDGIVAYMAERADPAWKPPPEAVLTLTMENFHETIGRESLILVEFYAPWCGHCKKLAPEYEKAAKILRDNDPPIPLAKVDATVESELGKEYEVSGYPTLKLFRKGRATEYKGPREQRGIVDYMVEQVSDASVLKTTLAEVLKTYQNMDMTDTAVVGVFTGEEDPLYLIFMDFANEHREDYTCVHTFTAAVATHYDTSPGALIVARPSRYLTGHEQPHYVMPLKDGATVADITAFVRANAVPLVGELDTRTREKVYKDKRPLVIAFYSLDWSFDHRQATQAWRLKVADIAAKHPHLMFAVADEDTMKDLWKEFGFDESGEEFNIGVLGDKDVKYPMEAFDSFDATDITDFISNFQKGKLKPKLKSQPLPKKKTAVTVVVGSNFDKVVKDPAKDVLLEFYAPWCGHCKKLEPIYKDLAKKFKKENSVVIAKIDATANDYPPEFESSGYPTIYMAPAGKDATPIKHDGGRELDDLEKFVREHATTLHKKDEL